MSTSRSVIAQMVGHTGPIIRHQRAILISDPAQQLGVWSAFSRRARLADSQDADLRLAPPQLRGDEWRKILVNQKPWRAHIYTA